ncbi:MAG: pyridoxal-dependent decarboxylase [Fimbriimonas sp.]|nr:pyridoxal-dependent decarboxylase [Fimbriimonas sp.]
MSEVSAWFAGPKGENGDWFGACIGKILQDYYSWRRNYFPEDGLVIDAENRRAGEHFQDRFDDRLFELLAKLKADFPFHSPRYAAHMLSEQTMPSIAGYFAAMLYNPNNVTSEAAPVTVRLEIEAAQMIARMVGYGDSSWAHLTSGGTIANLEGLWMARTVKYLPLVIRDMRQALGLPPDSPDFGCPPDTAFHALEAVFREAPCEEVIQAYLLAEHNVVEKGFSRVLARINSQPYVLAPETQHYSIRKALDVLGLGRRSLISVRVDRDFRMDIDDLRSKLDEIDERGDHVIAVVPVVGTTEEGAIDPVHKVVELRAERSQSFWIHADAAYGGYFRTVILPEPGFQKKTVSTVQVKGRSVDITHEPPLEQSYEALTALNECDSVTIDPHKLGYVPYPAGAICFKSDVVKPLARQDAPYIESGVGDVDAERGSESVGVYIIEGSKPGAAAASVWLSHTLIPLDRKGHGQLMELSVHSACELHALLVEYPQLCENGGIQAVPLSAPGSNIVCFAFRSNEIHSLAMLNDFNRRIYDCFTISNRSGRHVYDQPFFLSRTTLQPNQYSLQTVSSFVDRLGVSHDEYEGQGVFLLRSVLMNPWYGEAKRRGRYFISEFVEALYAAATDILRLDRGALN